MYYCIHKGTALWAHTCPFVFRGLDKCCLCSHLQTRQMNRVNIIQFIIFLKDLVRFALISGSSVRETPWSCGGNGGGGLDGGGGVFERKTCLSALNWEPHTQRKETQQLCQPFTSRIHLPKSIRQHPNWCSLYDYRAGFALRGSEAKWSRKLSG